MRRTLFATSPVSSLVGFSSLSLALALVLAPSPAGADMVSGTRSFLLFERSDVVDLVFDHGHATLVVQRTVENLGPKHDQALFDIYIPKTAVAVGLRTLGIVDGKPVWFTGELLEAELAAARYKELTGIGGWYPKDPALLSWRSPTELKLQVFPIAPKTKKTVEYTLEMPTRYVDGRYALDLSAMGTEQLPALMHPRAADPKDALYLDGAKLDAKLAAKGIPLDDACTLTLAPATPPSIGGTLASVSFAKSRAFVHASLGLPERLSEEPKGAYVVVVLDGSRSIRDDDRLAEVAAASAYLAGLPDAHVAVLTFARKVKARNVGFVGTKIALSDLETLSASFPDENGSAIDAALAEAARLLATAPAGAPRRVVALTDFHTRSAIEPKTISAFDADTIVHLATIGKGSAHLERDDDHPWAKLARATGGLLYQGAASTSSMDVEVMRDTFEEWVRPRHVERIVATGIGLDGAALSIPSVMREGEGWEQLTFATYASPAIAVTGELWSKKVSALLSSTSESEKLWSALVFGSDVRDSLNEKEMMTLAMKGGAVSPVTSYLAIEPGVRPSTEGLEEGGAGYGDGIGLGSLGSFGHGYGAKIVAMYDHAKFLQDELTAALTVCGGQGRKVHVEIETTYDEVVDVEVSVASVDGGKASGKAGAGDALEVCVGERFWSTVLPSGFRSAFHRFGVSSKA